LFRYCIVVGRYEHVTCRSVYSTRYICHRYDLFNRLKLQAYELYFSLRFNIVQIMISPFLREKLCWIVNYCISMNTSAFLPFISIVPPIYYIYIYISNIKCYQTSRQCLSCGLLIQAYLPTGINDIASVTRCTLYRVHVLFSWQLILHFKFFIRVQYCTLFLLPIFTLIISNVKTRRLLS
jgi:hypothetical protein